MPEQVQKIWERITEWWKKFSTKQKVLLGSVAATVVLALAILAFVVSTPTMVTLIQCENTAQAGEVKELLDGDEGVPYEMSQDGLTFYVDEKYEGTAAILLGKNSIPTQGFAIEKVFEGGFSSTEADKTKLYKLYMEEHFAEQLETLSNVEEASVTLDIPYDDGTILAREQDAYAAVILSLSSEMAEEQAYGLAQYIATQLGNDTTDNVLILDSDSNVLYSGADTDTAVGTASTQLSLRAKTENMVKSEVKDVLVGSGLYDHAEVATKLDMDFDQYRETQREYYPPDGQTNGMIGEQSSYESNSIGGAAAVPGTDANDDTPTYVIEDNAYNETNVTDTTTKYQNNEKVTDRTAATGKVNYDNSSIAIVLKDYVIYDEDTLRRAGELENMTFEEYIAANSAPVQKEVAEDRYEMIANATGFPVENISILAYDEPIFQYSTGKRTVSDYLQIILAVLILLLLGYVVFRSTRKDRDTELEEELSVESLLASAKENQETLEDIGYNEKSEIRLLIEKFVEENPEAAASLLRNWLNEEWE